MQNKNEMDKTKETIKRSVVARNWGEGEMNGQSTEDL